MENCIKCDGVILEDNIVTLGDVVDNDRFNHYFVKCPACGFAGPIYLMRSDAVWAWNYMSTLWKKLHTKGDTWKMGDEDRLNGRGANGNAGKEQAATIPPASKAVVDEIIEAAAKVPKKPKSKVTGNA